MDQGEQVDQFDQSGPTITNEQAYILKAKKFAEPLFQSKKFAEKCVNPGVIFGSFEVILGHFWAILDYFGSF